MVGNIVTRASVTQNIARHVEVKPHERYAIISSLTGIAGADGIDRVALCERPLGHNWYISELHMAWRFEAVPGGVAVEVESVAVISKDPLGKVKSSLRKLALDTLAKMDTLYSHGNAPKPCK